MISRFEKKKIYRIACEKKKKKMKLCVWIIYRGDFDFGGVNFGNSKSNCVAFRFPLDANKFGVVDDCWALLCMALFVALTVIGDWDDILLLVSGLVGSFIGEPFDWLLLADVVAAIAVAAAAEADAVRGVGVCGGDVHSCIAWLRVKYFPFPLF